MPKPLRVGLAGLGTVGTAVFKLLAEKPDHVAARAGRPVQVVAVSARSKRRKRDVDLGGIAWQDEPVARAASPEIELFIELIRGEGDPAKAAVIAALNAGKPVVTANKALLAERGHDLIALALANNADLYFEAAVGGGIPVIRTLRESLASDRVLSVRAILNGTSNYILSQMQRHGLSFAEALSGAQKAGYAEADPTLDVGGGDAAHKLAILTTLAFGARVRTRDILTEGIADVDAADIQAAKRFGYVFKPLAIAQATEDGVLSLRVHPALVPASRYYGDRRATVKQQAQPIVIS
jgi:homoserine dehydrogenase